MILLLPIARFNSGVALSWGFIGGTVDEDSPDHIHESAGTAYDTEAHYWLLKTLEIGCIRMRRVVVVTQRITFFRFRGKQCVSQFWRRTKHQDVSEFVAVPKIRRICHSLICFIFICFTISPLVTSDRYLGCFYQSFG